MFLLLASLLFSVSVNAYHDIDPGCFISTGEDVVTIPGDGLHDSLSSIIDLALLSDHTLIRLDRCTQSGTLSLEICDNLLKQFYRSKDITQTQVLPEDIDVDLTAVVISAAPCDGSLSDVIALQKEPVTLPIIDGKFIDTKNMYSESFFRRMIKKPKVVHGPGCDHLGCSARHRLIKAVDNSQ